VSRAILALQAREFALRASASLRHTARVQNAGAAELAGAGAVPWIDLVGLGLIVGCLAFGIAHGLWWQVLRLVGLLGAVLIARALAPRVAGAVQPAFAELSPVLVHGLAWLVCFVGGLLVFAWLGALGRGALQVLHLDLVDRCGGALAGALSGLLLHLALVCVLVQLAPQDWSARTFHGSYSARLFDGLAARYPIALARERGEDLGRRWLRSAPHAGEAVQPNDPELEDDSASEPGAQSAPANPNSPPEAAPVPSGVR